MPSDPVTDGDTFDGTATIIVLVVTGGLERGAALASALEDSEEPVGAVLAHDAESAIDALERGPVHCVVDARGDDAAVDAFREAVHRRRESVPFVRAADVAPRSLPDGVTDLIRTPIEDGCAPLIARRLRDYGRRYRAERDTAAYRELLAELPDAVVVHDATGNFQWANRRAVDLLGYDRAKLLEMAVHDVETTAGPAALEAALNDCDPGDTVTVDGRNRRDDGTVIPVRVSIRRLPDGDRFVATVRDVSELAARERDLERSLDLLEKTEELADAGGWELDLRSDDLRWTEGTRRIHGVDDDYDPTLEAAIDFYHPDDRDQMASAVDRAIEAGESFDETVRIVTASGETRTVRSRGEPSREGVDTVQVRGAIRDVTDYERAAAELRQREANLEQAQAVADLGSWHVDFETSEIEWSDEVYRLFGIEPDGDGTMSVERFLQFVHPEDREAVERRWFAAVERDGIDVEHRIVVDGETKWVREKAELVHDESDTPIEAVGVIQDVTDRKTYERRLEDMNEQLDVLNRLIRHDLRNQMNVIDGHAAGLENRLEAAEPRRQAAQIRDAVDELLSISEEVRRVNRTVADDPSGRPVSVASIVDDAVASVREEYTEFACERAVGDVWVRGTEALRIAVENLVRNAIEHNDGGTPQIEIDAECCPQTDTVRVRITDNGPGIPRSVRELVTGDRERTQLEHTSGVGLWIVTWIVSSVGGDLEFEEWDDGTTVAIELPLVEPDPGTQ